MPKRPNPFGDCSPLQLKQHVGTKEVDMGVARDQNMKAIYAKTRQLLFSGSKKSFIHTDANENHIVQPFVPTTTEVPMEAEMSPPPSAGQMHLTASGELTQERILAEKERPKSAWAALFNKKKVSTGGCCECCKNQAASQDRCGFCEKSVCKDCVRPCSSCEGSFCQLCSVMNYDDITERSFCLSCAS